MACRRARSRKRSERPAVAMNLQANDPRYRVAFLSWQHWQLLSSVHHRQSTMSRRETRKVTAMIQKGDQTTLISLKRARETTEWHRSRCPLPCPWNLQKRLVELATSPRSRWLMRWGRARSRCLPQHQQKHHQKHRQKQEDKQHQQMRDRQKEEEDEEEEEEEEILQLEVRVRRTMCWPFCWHKSHQNWSLEVEQKALLRLSRPIKGLQPLVLTSVLWNQALSLPKKSKAASTAISPPKRGAASTLLVLVVQVFLSAVAEADPWGISPRVPTSAFTAGISASAAGGPSHHRPACRVSISPGHTVCPVVYRDHGCQTIRSQSSTRQRRTRALALGQMVRLLYGLGQRSLPTTRGLHWSFRLVLWVRCHHYRPIQLLRWQQNHQQLLSQQHLHHPHLLVLLLAAAAAAVANEVATRPRTFLPLQQLQLLQQQSWPRVGVVLQELLHQLVFGPRRAMWRLQPSIGVALPQASVQDLDLRRCTSLI
mmetsp:Transcript_52476/g.111831  ORF Transcript_52476/g.111831 Transcript_52476/m.111831 type:complete len:482 (-) Transcript_52476:180-1625(-)